MARALRAEKPASRTEPRRSLVELEPRGLDALQASSAYSDLAEGCRKRETLVRAAAAVDPVWLRESEHAAAIELIAELRANSDHIVVLGSAPQLLAYRLLLATRPKSILEDRPAVHLLGDGLDEQRLAELLGLCENRSERVAVVAVSSGPPTAHLAWLFRLLEQSLESRYGEAELTRRIALVCDTDGAELAERPYRQIALPESLRPTQLPFTPLGLLGLWLHGQDGSQACEGIRSQLRASEKLDVAQPSAVYALLRHLNLTSPGARETFLALSPAVQPLGEWWLSLTNPSPASLCLPSGLSTPAPVGTLDVTVEHREGSSDLHESYASLIRQAWSRRSASAGCLGAVVPRFDLFSLGALLTFFAVAARAGEAIQNDGGSE